MSREAARERGGIGRSGEGYAMVTTPGQEIVWGERYVGSRDVFAGAGLTEITRPTVRPVVMRINFSRTGQAFLHLEDVVCVCPLDSTPNRRAHPPPRRCVMLPRRQLRALAFMVIAAGR